jgi:asparagine synthase (glutamine-hydrolysing)
VLQEFHRETCRKIKALHMYDCLRANKSTSAWGIEARVPFLDKEFMNVAMAIDPKVGPLLQFNSRTFWSKC